MRCHGMLLLGASLSAIMMTCPTPLIADEAVERELKAIREELQLLRREVAEQGEMIRTLYDFTDAQVNFKKRIKERQEEERLLLEPAVEVRDPNLTSLGCGSPVAPEIAAITGDGGIRMYDMAGKVIRSLKRRGEIITALSYSPDGNFLLAGTRGGELLVWDLTRGEWTVVAENVADAVGRVAWLDGSHKAVWASSVDYHGEGGKKLNRDRPSGGVVDRETGHTAWSFFSFVRDDFQTLSSSPDGRKLAVLEIPDKPRAAYVLDGSTGRVLATLFHTEHACGPLSVCLGPDGNTVAVGYAPYDIILWNAREESLLKILQGHTNWVVSLAFSADGRFLISGAGDSTARIWSVDDGKELGRIRFPGSSTYVESVGFSPDDKMAFAMAKGKLLLIQALPGHSPSTK